MTHPLFGTDGIRGTAGTFPLDTHTIRRIGAALGKALPHQGAKLLIGRDTRESGEWIEGELAHGARAVGCSVQSGGVAPTPAVAYLTGARLRRRRGDLGVSHPYQTTASRCSRAQEK
jgi:phosphoglucosamine mutase